MNTNTNNGDNDSLFQIEQRLNADDKSSSLVLIDLTTEVIKTTLLLAIVVFLGITTISNYRRWSNSRTRNHKHYVVVESLSSSSSSSSGGGCVIRNNNNATCKRIETAAVTTIIRNNNNNATIPSSTKTEAAKKQIVNAIATATGSPTNGEWWDDLAPPFSFRSNSRTMNSDDSMVHEDNHSLPPEHMEPDVIHFCFLVHGHRGISKDLSYLQHAMEHLAENEIKKRWNNNAATASSSSSSSTPPMMTTLTTSSSSSSLEDNDNSSKEQEEDSITSSSASLYSYHDFVVHSAVCNEQKTTDGVINGGERLAEEIVTVIRQEMDTRYNNNNNQYKDTNTTTTTYSNTKNNGDQDAGLQNETIYTKSNCNVHHGDNDTGEGFKNITLSIVGNSLGGVYGRYAIAKLSQMLKLIKSDTSSINDDKNVHSNSNDDNNNVHDEIWVLDNKYRVYLNIFCTTATPHLGISKHTYVPLPRTAEIGVANILGDTGQDLFRVNDLLKDMSTKSKFLNPLQKFNKRIAYANAYATDFPVPVSTAAFLSAHSNYPHHFLENHNNTNYLHNDDATHDKKATTINNNNTLEINNNQNSNDGFVVATCYTFPKKIELEENCTEDELKGKGTKEKDPSKNIAEVSGDDGNGNGNGNGNNKIVTTDYDNNTDVSSYASLMSDPLSLLLSLSSTSNATTAAATITNILSSLSSFSSSSSPPSNENNTRKKCIDGYDNSYYGSKHANELIQMSASLDSLGWKKVFIDVRKTIPIGFNLPGLTTAIGSTTCRNKNIDYDIMSREGNNNDSNHKQEQVVIEGNSATARNNNNIHPTNNRCSDRNNTTLIHRLQQKRIATSKDIYNALSLPDDNKLSFPIGHNMMVALSRTRMNALIYKGGRPVVESLANELVQGIFSYYDDINNDNNHCYGCNKNKYVHHMKLEQKHQKQPRTNI